MKEEELKRRTGQQSLQKNRYGGYLIKGCLSIKTYVVGIPTLVTTMYMLCNEYPQHIFYGEFKKMIL